jgi:hypothetical protein
MCSDLPTTRRLRIQLSRVRYRKSRNTRPACPTPRTGVCLGALFAEHCLEAGVACQAEHVIDAVRFAPPHQRLVGKATIAAQDDAHPRPRLADLGDDAYHLLDRAIAAGNVRTSLPGQQQMPAAEHIERQVAVAIIITAEEPAFLPAVQRNVGIVEVDHDLARRTLMRLQEKFDQQRVNLWPVTVDLVILRGVGPRCVFKTVQRALARQASQSDRSTGCGLPVSTPNVGSLRRSS